MLTAIKKAFILTQVGIDVPRFPVRDMSASVRHSGGDPCVSSAQGECDVVQLQAVNCWNQEIEILFVTYIAARAAKSLRDAEQARQSDMLRRANAKPWNSS